MRRAVIFTVAFLSAYAMFRVLIPQPAGFVEPTAAAEDAPAVSLKVMGFDDVQKLVASKKGQVVVLDAWSTSCVPCMREFPHLVELHKAFGDKVACPLHNWTIGLADGQALAPDEGSTPTFRVKVVEDAVYLDGHELAHHALHQTRPLAGPALRAAHAS